MKKILFYIDCLACAGAEKSLTELVESLDKSKYDITVITVTDGEFFTERVRNACNYRCFVKKSTSNNRIKKYLITLKIAFAARANAKLVYRVFIRERYDVEIAFVEGFAIKLIANSANRCSKKIAFIHTDMQNNHWTHFVFKDLREETDCLKKFDLISCVSETVAKAFNETFGILKNVVVNLNPVNAALIEEMAKEPSDLQAINCPRMIAVGRMTPVKSYDRLLRIANQLVKENIRFELLILGQGVEEENLKRYIEENDMSSYVKLMGFQPNPYKYMAGCDFFVCSSLAEGYSTTATESIILGKPVITVECSGMAELFGGYACGLICENSEVALFETIKAVLTNPACLQVFGDEAKKRALFFYKESSIANIEKMFD